MSEPWAPPDRQAVRIVALALALHAREDQFKHIPVCSDCLANRPCQTAAFLDAYADDAVRAALDDAETQALLATAKVRSVIVEAAWRSLGDAGGHDGRALTGRVTVTLGRSVHLLASLQRLAAAFAPLVLAGAWPPKTERA